MPQVLRVLSVEPDLDEIDDDLAGVVADALEGAELSYPEEGDEASYDQLAATLECIAKASPAVVVRVLYDGLSDAWFDWCVLRVQGGEVGGEPVALTLEAGAPEPAVLPHEVAPLVDIALAGGANLADLARRFEAAADGREVEVGEASLRLPFYFDDMGDLLDAAAALAPYLSEEHVKMLVRVSSVPAWLVVTRGEGAAVHPVYAWANDEHERGWLQEQLGEIEPAERSI